MGMEGGTWQKSVLTLVDVQRLAGRHELAIGPKVVITPLALEEIRRLGLTLSRQESSPVLSSALGVGQDRAYAEVQSALMAMARDGILFQPLGRPEPALQLANQCGARIARGEWQRAVLFSSEPELAACAAKQATRFACRKCGEHGTGQARVCDTGAQLAGGGDARKDILRGQAGVATGCQQAAVKGTRAGEN